MGKADNLFQQTIYEIIKHAQSLLTLSEGSQTSMHYSIDGPDIPITGTSSALSVFISVIYHYLKIPEKNIPFATGGYDLKENKFTTVADDINQKIKTAMKMGAKTLYCIQGQKTPKQVGLKVRNLNPDPLISFFEILKDLPISFAKSLNTTSFLNSIETNLKAKRDATLEELPLIKYFLEQKTPCYDNIFARLLMGKSFLNRGQNQKGLLILSEANQMISKLRKDAMLPSEQLIKFGHIIAQNAIAHLDTGLFDTNAKEYDILKINIAEIKKLNDLHQSFEFAYLLLVNQNTLARIFEYQGRWTNDAKSIRYSLELRLSLQSHWISILQNCKGIKDFKSELNFQYNQIIDSLFSLWLIKDDISTNLQFLKVLLKQKQTTNNPFDLLADIKLQLIYNGKINTNLEIAIREQIENDENIFNYPNISILCLLLKFGSSTTKKLIKTKCLSKASEIKNGLNNDQITSLLFCQLIDTLDEMPWLQSSFSDSLIGQHKNNLLNLNENIYIKIPY